MRPRLPSKQSPANWACRRSRGRERSIRPCTRGARRRQGREGRRGAPAAGVRAVIEREAGERARAIQLFDVYAGPPLPEDRVSLAFTLELAALDRTLTYGEADQLLARLRDALTRECQAEFR